MRKWQERFGAGTFRHRAAARVMQPLVAAGHSPETIAEHLKEYLERTDSHFVSLVQFAMTFAHCEETLPVVDEDGVINDYWMFAPKKLQG